MNIPFVARPIANFKPTRKVNRQNKLLPLLSLLLVSSCSKSTSVELVDPLPNIIYILADDLGYGDIGAYNPGSKILTPNIDNLAAQGMRFMDAHSSSSVCTPTRYSILTGRYNWRSPLKSSVLTGSSKALISNDRTTVASLLKTKNYHTAFIGKWHLGWDWGLKDSTKMLGSGWNPTDFDNIDFTKSVSNNPNDLGFDYAYGHSGSLDMAPYAYVENGRVTSKVDSVSGSKEKYSWWRTGPTAADFDHEDVTPNFFRRSIEYIEQRAQQEHPFFLYLPLPSPHTPILPSKSWQGKSKINPYADFMMMIDYHVGELVDAVEKQGIADNTIIIFTSDNGCSPQANFEVLAESGHDPSYIYRGHKADIYEGGHRVPFIVKWPAHVKANSLSQQTICQTDLMATCADIMGSKLNDDEGEDSYSLLPILTGDSTAYERRSTIHHSINGSFAIRNENWKLIFCGGSGGWSKPKPNSPVLDSMPPYQLYDLVNDPSEQDNLYTKHPGKMSELNKLMIDIIKNGRSTKGRTQANETLNLEGKAWKEIEKIVNDRAFKTK